MQSPGLHPIAVKYIIHSSFIYIYVLIVYGDHGSIVVKVLCYKLEGLWFDSRWCHWDFSLT